MYEVEGVHALCADCGGVLHLPWLCGSSVAAIATGLGERLQAGCALCGGSLRLVTLDACESCAVMAGDEVATGWASGLADAALH